MIIQNTSKLNKLAIFFFYDKDGVVDDYITYLLEDMKRNVSELMVVCNGVLTPEGRKKFLQITDNILVRENVGFDVWAYKSAIDLYGFDKLSTFDEVVFFNFTIFGPLYPFSEMFSKMDTLDVDFWGITEYHEVDYDPFGTIKYGYIPRHIQSHFIVVRSSMLLSIEFKKYWTDMQPITSYEEAIGFHEAIFTKHFEGIGFKSSAYIDTKSLSKHTYDPLIMIPRLLVEHYKCPIIKRKSFFHSLDYYLSNTTNEQSIELLNYIKRINCYDIDLIWGNILRVENQALIKRNLNLNYILPSNIAKNPILPAKKILLVIHIHFIDLITYCFRYASSMPEYADVYITTNSQNKKELIEQGFGLLKCNSLKVVVIENRGRDVSALLVATKKIINNYDYVCFVHDKKTLQVQPHSMGESFAYKCFDNTLCSPEFVLNVISTFDENPRLGLLTPPPPNNGSFFPTIGFEWGPNFEITKNLAVKLGLKVNMQESLEPVAPLGTMFWFKPEALNALFAADWDYEDFPEEPNGYDGTLLHAIERIYPYVVQHEGFYPAWLFSDNFAKIEITNLHYMLREMTIIGMNKYGFNNFHGLKTVFKSDNYKPKIDTYIPTNLKFKVFFMYKLKLKLKQILPEFVLKVLKKIVK